MHRILLVLSLCSGIALALPKTLSQEGYLQDAQGQALEGEVTLSFSLYAQELGGLALWTEEHSVQVALGYYSVDLGAQVPLPSLDQVGALYLGIKINGTAEMQPRHRLHSVPFALLCEEATGDLHPQTVWVNGQQIIDAGGHWVGPAVENIEGGGYTTPETLLLALRSVDGPGTDLNSDTLDGFQAEEFVQDGEQVLDRLRGHGGEGSGLNVDLLDGLDHSDLYHTSAQVIQSLQGLGGAGSGLNADRLDGKDSSEFYTTGEHLIQALQGLGGDGSGLNADLIDGLDSADLLNRNDPNLEGQIFQLLLNGGGEASGLNADTLDGIDSAEFMRVDTHTGTSGALSVALNMQVNGGVLLGGDLQVAGEALVDGALAIGLEIPEAKLHVQGAVKSNTFTLAPSGANNAPQPGMIYFNAQTHDFMGYDGQGWVLLNSSTSTQTSCLEIKRADPNAADGLYWIDPKGDGLEVQVWCDMTTDGGGWMVVGRASETNGVGGDYEFRAAVGAHSLLGMSFDHGGPTDPQYTLGLDKLIPDNQMSLDIQYYCYDSRDPGGTNFWIKAEGIDANQLQSDLSIDNPDFLYDAQITNKDGIEANGLYAFFHRERVAGLQCGNSYAGQNGMKFDCSSNGQAARTPGIVWYLTHYDGNYSEVNSCGPVGGGVMPYYAGEVRIRWDWDTVPYESCQMILSQKPDAPSQEYWIDIDGGGPLSPFQAYCDMDTDGGGWMRLNLFSRQWGNSQGFGSDPLGSYGERISGVSSKGALDNLNSCNGDSQVALKWTDNNDQLLSADHIAALNAQIISGFTTDYRIFDADGGGDWDKVKGCYDGQVVMWGDGDEQEGGANQQWVGPYAVDHLSALFTTGIYGGNSDASGYNASLPQYWYFRTSNLGRTPSRAALSCLQIKEESQTTQDGMYWLDFDGSGGNPPSQYHCDMNLDGGGWTLVTQDMILEEDKRGVNIGYGADGNGGLIMTVTPTRDGCGGNESGHTVLFDDSLEWTQIRADHRFYGGTSCWSIFGRYEGYGFDVGDTPSPNLHDFDPAEDLIRDQVRMGGSSGDAFSGMIQACNNEATNFWHSARGNGERRAIVILRRVDLGAPAGLSAGVSCTDTNTTSWKYQSIYVR